MSVRPVKRVSQSQPTLESAGVHLRRAFGFGDTSAVDPLLLLDVYVGGQYVESVGNLGVNAQRALDF